jgi:hypothetical protein
MKKAQKIAVARVLVKSAFVEKIDAFAVRDFTDERIGFPEFSGLVV